MIPVKFSKDSLKHTRTLSSFYSGAKDLKQHFKHTFESPLQASSKRFCWDYWSIKDQYRLLRTPAQSLFPEKIFKPFLNHLLNWGRQNLGCQMISHPWLSSYIDGSFQNLHSDVPHGPFSFVFSLTDWQSRLFSGGETLVAKPKLLRYFSEIDPNLSHEEKDFFERIAPKFNQLTLFDPRYPHGVSRVNGVESVLDSRLVIHGWFTEPRPMIEGALGVKQISKHLDQLAESLLEKIGALPYSGLLSLRFKISPLGKITSIEVLSGHLIDLSGNTIPPGKLKTILGSADIIFPKSKGSTLITLPLQFYS